MTHHFCFAAIETYLHKNVYPSDIIGDEGKKANFSKGPKPFSMLHGNYCITTQGWLFLPQNDNT